MDVGHGVAIAVLAGRELAEVARGHRTDIVIELEDDPSGRLGVDCDVELGAGQGQHRRTNLDTGAATHKDVSVDGGGVGSGVVELSEKKDHPFVFPTTIDMLQR